MSSIARNGQVDPVAITALRMMDQLAARDHTRGLRDAAMDQYHQISDLQEELATMTTRLDEERRLRLAQQESIDELKAMLVTEMQANARRRERSRSRRD